MNPRDDRGGHNIEDIPVAGRKAETGNPVRRRQVVSELQFEWIRRTFPVIISPRVISVGGAGQKGERKDN